MGEILFDGVQLQNSANFGAGVFVDQNVSPGISFVRAMGTDFGSTTNYVDYNNVTSAPHISFFNTNARPYESATSRRFVNAPAGRWPVVIGSQNDGSAESQRAMNSFHGSVTFVDHNNHVNRRTLHWRSGGIMSLYECDPATAACLAFDWDAGDLRFYKSDGASHLLHINRNSSGGNTVGFGRTAPASGIVGFANNEAIVARNAVNSSEISLIRLNASDQLELGGTSTGFPKFMATSGNAPFVVNSGVSKVTNLDSDKWDGKDGLDFSASLDFPSIAAQSCAELNITATGAATGNPIAPAWPTALEASLIGNMRVSAADTVTVRLCNVGASSVDPASQSFGGRIIK